MSNDEKQVQETVDNMNPKAGQALIEIRQVLEKYDIAGFVAVHSQVEGEFATHFPSWSIAQFKKGQDGKPYLAINSTQGQVSQDQIKATFSMLKSIKTMAAQEAITVDTVTKKLGNALGIDPDLLFQKPSQDQGSGEESGQ